MSPAAESLTNRTARAARWRFAGTVVTGVTQLAVGIMLARLLTPADFGTVALALVVIGFGQTVFDFGIGAALVQRTQLTDRHVRTGFTFSVLLGVTLCTLVALLAPVGAYAMREPMVTPVLRVLAVGFAFQGLAVVADALLRRRLDLRRQFFIDVVSNLLGFSAVALSLALLGYGLWSLVWASLMQTVLASAGQLAAVRHPARPRLARPELADLLRFGAGAALSRAANFFALHGDNLVIGRWMGAPSLGLYDRAYTLMKIPNTYVSVVLSAVLFPALSQVQDEPERLRRGYLTATRVTAAIAGPAMATLIVAAPHLVPVLYGAQWTGMVVPLQILCIAGYLRALYHLGGAVAQSVGRVYGDLWRQMVYATLVIGGALVTLPYGLAGISAAVVIAILFMFVATGDLALSATGASWAEYFRVQRAALITSVLTFAAAMAARVAVEAVHASDAAATTAILSAAAVPWSLGMLWTLGADDLGWMRRHLPRVCVQLIVLLQKARTRSDRQDR